MRGLESESPACTMYWVVVPFAVIGNSGKGARSSENWVVRDTQSSPHPLGGEGGWRRGLRAAKRWYLFEGKGRALPIVGEGLRTGEAPRGRSGSMPTGGWNVLSGTRRSSLAAARNRI